MLRYESITIDADRHRVTVGEEEVKLTAKEFLLLEYLHPAPRTRPFARCPPDRCLGIPVHRRHAHGGRAHPAFERKDSDAQRRDRDREAVRISAGLDSSCQFPASSFQLRRDISHTIIRDLPGSRGRHTPGGDAADLLVRARDGQRPHRADARGRSPAHCRGLVESAAGLVRRAGRRSRRPWPPQLRARDIHCS